jgi:cardiolipin synthase
MNWLTVALILTILALDLYTIVLAVMRGHSAESALAWVFAILALPGVGALAYLLLASPSIRRTSRKKRRTRRRAREAVSAVSGEETRPQPKPEPIESLLELAERLTDLPPTRGNRVELLSHDARAFRRMEESIREAKKTIWAEYYIICNDETGLRFLDLLAAKAAEGVEVRLLYDAVGSLGLDRQRLAAIVRAGGHAEAFLPLNPLRRRWAVHLRNHRKIVLIDGRVALIGGMNIGDEYSGRARRRGRRFFRDSHLLIAGPAVGDLAQTFTEDWTFATDEVLVPQRVRSRAVENGATVAVVPSGPDQERNASRVMFFSGICAAQRQLFLCSPYFVPDGPTLAALQAAALRGVDVRIMVPAVNDVPLVHYAARTYFASLLRDGIRIFEYQPSILHAKTLVVDGAWGIVGSANVDFRSFGLNFELSALVADTALAAELVAQFTADQECSVELTLKMLAQEGPLRRFRDHVARLLSPLL